MALRKISTKTPQSPDDYIGETTARRGCFLKRHPDATSGCRDRKIFWPDAFTLIEVLVVLAIMVLLAALVLVGLNEPRQISTAAQTLSDVELVQQRLAYYRATVGRYPKYLISGQSLAAKGVVFLDIIPFLPDTPLNSPCRNPSNDLDLLYFQQNNGASYALYFCLPADIGKNVSAGLKVATPQGINSVGQIVPLAPK